MLCIGCFLHREALELTDRKSNGKASSDRINKIDIIFGLCISKGNNPANPADPAKLSHRRTLVNML